MTVPEKYLRDASNLSGTAENIYFPKDASEASHLLKEFQNNQVPVTIAGAGTGLTGAGVPKGGIVISTESMNRLSEVEIGKIKTAYLEWMYGREGVRQMARVKKALDPSGILNPGNMISLGIWNEVSQGEISPC